MSPPTINIRDENHLCGITPGDCFWLFLVLQVYSTFSSLSYSSDYTIVFVYLPCHCVYHAVHYNSSGLLCYLCMWSLTVLGLLAAATIFNILGMVGLSLIFIYSHPYNKCKSIQTLVQRGGKEGNCKENKCLGTAR